MVSEHLRVLRGVHNDNIVFWTARILDPPLKESARVFASTASTSTMCCCSRRRTVDTGSLARHRVSGTQPLVQQIDVLNLALDVPVGVAVLFVMCRSLVENFLEVAGAIDDDAEVLFYDVLG